MGVLTYLSKDKNSRKSFPMFGWIHQCIFCSELTSMTEPIYHHKIYCCGKCSVKYDMRTKYNFVIQNFKTFDKV